MAYSKLYRESGTNKMAPAAFNCFRARTIGCSIQSFFLDQLRQSDSEIVDCGLCVVTYGVEERCHWWKSGDVNTLIN